MKRCPECQFLYENETLKCDMDGTPLRHTVALPSLPGLARSIWDKWTIALLGAVILGTLFVILYRATPRAYTSSVPTHANSENGQMPLPPQSEQPAETANEMSARDEAADASDTSDGTSDPVESQSSLTATKQQRSKRSAPLADDEQPSPAPVIHFNPASNLPSPGAASNVTNPAATEGSIAGKSVTQTPIDGSSSSANSAHPTPPVGYSNKPATQNEKKDSGLKSFFKKAGKVLKKPFGDN